MTQVGNEAAITEAEARAALRAFVGVGGIEQWINAQDWEPTLAGWTVQGLRSWLVRIEPVPGKVRIVMSMHGGDPAAWTVPAVLHR
jgi:hypothetical protein